MTAWTNKKLARLKECYAIMTRAQLIQEFAPHSIGSIIATANKLRLRRRKDWKAVAEAHEPVVFGVRRVRETVE